MNTTNQPTDPLLISFLAIRKTIGALGLLLPIVLLLVPLIFNLCPERQASISDYYYTKMGSYFTGTLCAFSLFLFSYKGYDKADRVSSLLACVFALGVVFFPTSINDLSSSCYVITTSSSKTTSIIHYTFAACFFVTLSYMSLFLFTKTSGEPTPRKLKRNIIYKICGCVMLVSIVSILVFTLFFKEALNKYHPTFYLETVTLLAFSLSWLTKGEAILKDTD